MIFDVADNIENYFEPGDDVFNAIEFVANFDMTKPDGTYEIDGEDVISIRPMCYISLTIDHRVLDGYQTNAFLTELVSTLENWS